MPCPKNPALFRFSGAVAQLTGKPATFVIAVAGILIWALTGPLFGFSETWQLVVNTGTTIITFLMVFVLQNSQNRDGKAVQAKARRTDPDQRGRKPLRGIENLDEKELRRLTSFYGKRRKRAGSRAGRKGRSHHPRPAHEAEKEGLGTGLLKPISKTVITCEPQSVLWFAAEGESDEPRIHQEIDDAPPPPVPERPDSVRPEISSRPMAPGRSNRWSPRSPSRPQPPVIRGSGRALKRDLRLLGSTPRQHGNHGPDRRAGNCQVRDACVDPAGRRGQGYPHCR